MTAPSSEARAAATTQNLRPPGGHVLHSRATTGRPPNPRLLGYMALRDLSDPQAVITALDEAAAIGREPFLAKYDFGKATRYMVRGRDDELYDSKAIAAAAHGYQFGQPLTKYELSGGVDHAAGVLRSLGFEIVDTRQPVEPAAAFELSELEEGRAYSWQDLGEMFGFEPGWLNRTGGMGSLPRHEAVLIITHPGGGKSFDYDDYWDGADLIYTGKGQVGDQRRVGENRYVGDNARTVLAFEQAGPAQLRYLGSPICVDEWPETARDRHGDPRRVIRFRLRFDAEQPLGGDGANGGRPKGATREPSADPDRRPRAFDASRPPQPRETRGRARREPAETAALQEKAMQTHHALVAGLDEALRAAGWSDVSEIPVAIDLWGRSSDGARTIFEVKTLRPDSELGRVRAAISQLLEYRFFFGAPEDGLCLVTDHPLSDKRVRLLRALGIAVLVVEGDRLLAGSPGARERFPSLLDAEPRG